MDNSLNYKRKAILLLVGAVVLLLFILGAKQFYHKIYSEQYFTGKFQKSLLNKEKEVDEILFDKLQFIKESDSVTNYQSLYNLFNTESSSNISFCVFQADSLIYWSNNEIQVFWEYDLNNFDGHFQNISNGWYVQRKIYTNEFKLIGLIKIKNDYLYENDYLDNAFTPFFNLPDYVNISLEGTKNTIKNSEDIALFALDFSSRIALSKQSQTILALLFVLFFALFLSAIYYFYKLLHSAFYHRFFLFFAFIIDVLIIRIVVFYFQFPGYIHNSPLFSPEFFASSVYNPSMGDLLLNLISLIAMSYAFYQIFSVKKIITTLSHILKVIFSLLFLVLIFFAFDLLFNSLEKIVINSGISLNLTDITSISFFSVIGFFCYGLYILSFFLFTFKPILFVFESIGKKVHLLFILITLTLLSILLNYLIHGDFGTHFIFLFLILTVFFYIVRYSEIYTRFSSTVLFILLFSLFSTYTLNKSNQKKEKEARIILAENLTNKRDPHLEYIFSLTSQKIRSDTALNRMLIDYLSENYDNNEAITSHIFQNYFTSFFSKYNIQLTVCDTGRVLDIQPDNIMINCFEFFDQEVTTFGDETDIDNLFYMDYEFTDDYYLGIISFLKYDIPINLYIEIYNKNIPKGIGYPELLRDKETKSDVNWSDYSYSRYKNGKLVSRFGKFFYTTKLSHYNVKESAMHFFTREGFNHLIYPIDENNHMIVSRRSPGFLDLATPFSYISIFYGFLAFLFFILFRSPVHISFRSIGFKKRLQLSVTALIISSFLIIGAGSLYYIIRINHNKNISILREKSHSVLIELEHKLAAEPELPKEMEYYLSDLLYKFSLVFFTDINLYDLSGRLLATSRPEVFNEGLVSELINSKAFINMHDMDRSLFIQQEKIGDYYYLSAYLPFQNQDNKLIAYLNLPYFAKQDELTSEITTFLVAFINIYVILIAFAIYIALIISNYITKPVELIKEKIRNLKLGKTEEKIEWKRDDEIGSLVNEYNRMVDELALSAELLAKSERESAWREMAKQIAHEIKNPLTPMKLSVQYLKKAWENKDPEWEKKLDRFTKTIIEQINSLSIIATEFSDFAKMPRSKYEVLNLNESINNSIGIFKSSTEIRFELNSAGDHYVFADKEQLLRVFNNLLKNAVQAIPDHSKGLIRINVYTKDLYHHIEISDNGKGIPEEEKSKVFYPNFTTKSGGMGLGLALVKNIIESAKGKVSFDSTEGEGTTFTISLPIYQS